MQGKNENMHCTKGKTQGTLASQNYFYNSLLRRHEIFPSICLFDADRTLLHVNEEVLSTLW